MKCECGKIPEPGKPYDVRLHCRKCWRYATSPRHRALFDGLPVPPRPNAPPKDGPGTELAALLKEWGFEDTGCGGCSGMAARMNRWGIAGCREHRAEIVEHLKKQAGKLGWAAAALAWMNPLDVFGSLVDEAIRRAAKKPPSADSPASSESPATNTAVVAQSPLPASEAAP